ncbi:MAG: hypothetical protein Q7R93_01685 [bacterium]|nr:hypothetical protein [bacterium]
MDKGYLTVGLITLAVIAGIVGFTYYQQTAPGKLDGFATCLKEKSATFYGAFWCPHCQAQKKLFGRSQKLLPYVECSTPNTKGQLQVCIDKKIEGYPTWEFADGSRESKEFSLEQLAEKTSCELPL